MKVRIFIFHLILAAVTAHNSTDKIHQKGLNKTHVTEIQCPDRMDFNDLVINDARAYVYLCLSGIATDNKLENDLNLFLKASNVSEKIGQVLSNYCPKIPEFRKCVENYVAPADPCHKPVELEVVVQTKGRLVETVLDFICEYKSNVTAFFTAKKGLNCLRSRSYETDECLMSSDVSALSENVELPVYVLSETCHYIQTFHTCLMSSLNKCNETSSTHVLDSMFSYIKENMSCAKL